MIYTSARWANEARTLVIGTDSEGNTETVSYEHKVFRMPEHGPLGFIASGGVISDYIPPVTVTPVPCPTCGGSGVAPGGVK